MLVEQVEAAAPGLLGVSNVGAGLDRLVVRSAGNQDINLLFTFFHKAAVEALQSEAQALQTEIESGRSVF